MTLNYAVAEQAQQFADGIWCAYMKTTVKAGVPTLLTAVDTYMAGLQPLKQCEDLTCSLTLQPYPVSLLNKCVSWGGNVLGLDPSDARSCLSLALTWWKEKADDEKITDAFKGVSEGIYWVVTSRCTLVPFKYLDYAWDFQDSIGSYGVEDKTFLQVSRKYDPGGLFQKGVPGGFKLFR